MKRSEINAIMQANLIFLKTMNFLKKNCSNLWLISLKILEKEQIIMYIWKKMV